MAEIALTEEPGPASSPAPPPERQRFLREIACCELARRACEASAKDAVDVMGDGRRYDYVVALHALETIDFMTAH